MESLILILINYVLPVLTAIFLILQYANKYGIHGQYIGLDIDGDVDRYGNVVAYDFKKRKWIIISKHSNKKHDLRDYLEDED